MADDRNPSPAPEDSYEIGDRIGQTTFSKRFALNLLLHLIKMTKETNEATDEEEELDAETEQSLCQLWDMSVDPEILVGILANVASDPENLTLLMRREDLANLCLSLFKCRDTRTLVETTRLVLSVIQMDRWTDKWSEKFVTMEVWVDISFIISSNTNVTLLSNISLIIDGLLEKEKTEILDNLLSNPPESWRCLLEATDELLKAENLQGCSSYIHCIQSISVTKDGAVALALHGKNVFPCVYSCLRYLSKVDDVMSSTVLDTLCSLFLIFRSTLTQNNWNEISSENCDFLSVLLTVAQKLKNESMPEKEELLYCIDCLKFMKNDLSEIIPTQSRYVTVLSEISDCLK